MSDIEINDRPLSLMVLGLKPMYEMSSAASRGAFSVKVPSASVIVPFVVPATFTVAPITGSPFSSPINPLTMPTACRFNAGASAFCARGGAMAAATCVLKAGKQPESRSISRATGLCL